MKRIILAGSLAALLMIAIVTVFGCQKQSESKEKTGSTTQTSAETTAKELEGSVRVGGSTTVLPLAQAAAEEFMVKNPSVRVEVQGTGSSEGITGVSEGTLDIGDSSRELKDEEKSLDLVDHIVAIDVVAFVVNPANGVKNLTKDQIVSMLTGKISNWKEVGGKDAKIQVIGRDEASGTREYVQKEVIGADAKFVSDALALPGTGQLKAAVAQTPDAIGYMSAGQIDTTVRALEIDGVKPSKETIEDKTYPFWRNLHMFTKGEAEGVTKAFIDFVISEDFQTNTVSKEFFPIAK